MGLSTILDKIDGKVIPPTPSPPPPPPLRPRKSKIGKWRVSAFARIHPWFGGMGVCISVLFCPSLRRRLEVEGTRKNGRARRRQSPSRARPFYLSPTASKRLLRRLILSKIVAFLIEIYQFVSPASENFWIDRSLTRMAGYWLHSLINLVN